MRGTEVNVATQILVAYATKRGSTAEIAEHIGEALREEGLTADVLPADQVEDLTAYRAVILGSAVYIGRWQKEAARFLKANEEELADRLVWLFSSGPTGEGRPEELVDGWRFPEPLKPVADRIGPEEITVFHGELDPRKLNIIEKWMVNNVGASMGDFRDWDAITAWARSVANVVKAERGA
jgi:menaquinone-dependent protoporphyrinogen oxidase